MAPVIQTQQSTQLSRLVDDAVRLDQPSATARFDALLNLLDDSGLAYEIETFPNDRSEDVGPANGRNVVVTVGSGERDIVIGAHADAAILPDGSLSHAMVDNAAAVVVLIRLAQALQHHELHHRVKLVFFDLEELNLLGSKHFAKNMNRPGIAGMINLDIVGYGDTLIYGPAAAAGNDELYASIRQICAYSENQCLEFPSFPPSDDRSFQAADIPNVSLATLPRLEAHQLWLLLNTNNADSGLDSNFVPPILRTIHSPEDTIDKLDPTSMTLAYNLLLNLVIEFDQSTR
jgi:Zn-dependent M28 family amino/carboxypeptidase